MFDVTRDVRSYKRNRRKQNERRFFKVSFMFCVCVLRSLYKIMDVFLH
jgi:hypothetical protein